jgi:hypothetical protein
MTAQTLIQYVRKHRRVLGRRDHYFGAWHDPKTDLV